MVDRRAQQQSWIRSLLRSHSLTATQLAKRAKLAPSTVNKLLNDPDYGSLLSDRTLVKIANAFDIDVMAAPAAQSIADVRPYSPATDRQDAETVRVLLGSDKGRSAWIVTSFNLENIGLFPGDLLVVETGRIPKASQLALATVGPDGSYTARTYEPPYLLAASRSSVKPLVVDDDAVKIVGTVLWSLRPHSRGTA